MDTLPSVTPPLPERKATRSVILPTLLSGLMVGVDNVGSSLAVASLLFSGALVAGLQLGTQVLLLSSVVMAAGLRSAQPNAIGLVQETGIAILSAALLTMSGHLENVGEGARVATALAIIGAASLATGVTCLTVGWLRLGGFARFIPFPVVAGFLAGSGWMLVEGALAMVSGGNSEADTHGQVNLLDHLTHLKSLDKIGVTLLFAVGLIALLRRFSHPAVLPGFLVASGALFYLALFAFDLSPEQARIAGWLPQAAAGPTTAGAISLGALPGQVVWPEVWGALPSILSVALLNLLGAMLNSSGLELATGRELDANAELKGTGVANLLVTPFGGASGYMGLGVTLLAERMGATTRWTGAVAAAATALGLMFAGPLISVMPAFLTAGIVLFLGLELLQEWLLTTWRTLPRTEWVVVFLVVLVTGAAGFLNGLALGIAVAMVLFVVNYARLPVLRNTTSGADQRSNVDRSLEATHHLQKYGDAIALLQIHGYLFFGSTVAIVDWISRRLAKDGASPLLYVVLDMRRVQGADSSAMACFAKIHKLAEGNGFRVFFSHLAPDLTGLFKDSGLTFAEGGIFSLEPDLDHALERCEEYLLARSKEPLLLDAEMRHHFEVIMGPHPRIPDMVNVLERLSFEREGVLIRRGDPADSFYFLESGSVRISLTLPDGRLLRLRTMTSGAIVGDIGVCLAQPRVADVIANGPVVAYRLTTTALERLEVEDPALAILFHRLLARALAEKVVVANAALRASQG
ncbi:MAG: SLC26A/SulP transporter family protein [Magnetococcales bacterium]|nr:SLC26A/SulP transporter family protein [Magnetococcales bacterium]